MNDLALTLVVDYGVWVVFCVTFFSCLAIPVPSSLLMLAAGGFSATGDLSLPTVISAALSGAILGDNSGYWIARFLGSRAEAWIAKKPKRNALLKRGAEFLEKRGGPSIFFSCWLAAPLGPYMNYVCGITHYTWTRFAIWGVLGEVVWVGLYVGLGYIFADNISELSSLLGNVSGLVTALAIVIGLGWWLVRSAKKTQT